MKGIAMAGAPPTQYATIQTCKFPKPIIQIETAKVINHNHDVFPILQFMYTNCMDTLIFFS